MGEYCPHYPEYNQTIIPVDVPGKMVVGFSFGSFGNKSDTDKFFMSPEQVGDAWKKGMTYWKPPRGVMYWNSLIDGSPGDTGGKPTWFARGFNKFLKVRPASSEEDGQDKDVEIISG